LVFLQEFAKEYQVLSVEKQQNTTEEGKIKNFIVLKPSLINSNKINNNNNNDNNNTFHGI